jgi:hypothetical protein
MPTVKARSRARAMLRVALVRPPQAPSCATERLRVLPRVTLLKDRYLLRIFPSSVEWGVCDDAAGRRAGEGPASYQEVEVSDRLPQGKPLVE